MDGIETYRAGGKTVRVITERAIFARFGRRWNSALQDYPLASIYTSHQWLDAMWEAYEDEIDGRVVVIDDAIGPCALAPLMGMRYRYRGLSIPAVGPLDHERSARSDVALLRDQPLCAELLCDTTKRWGANLWHLDRLPATSEMFRLVSADWDTGRRIEHYESPSLALIETTCSWQEYLERKDKGFREYCRTVQGNLDGIDIAVLRDAEPVIAALHVAAKRGWTGWEGQVVLADPRRLKFLERILHAAAEDRTLHAVVAFDGGEPVGITIGIEFNQTLYAIDTLCDTSYRNRSVDVGTLAELIWHSFDAPRIRTCDLDTVRLPDDPRRRWATSFDTQINALVMNGGMGSAAIRAGRKLGGIKRALTPARKPSTQADWTDADQAA